MRIGIDLDNTIINYDAAFIAAAQFFKLDLPASCKEKRHIKKIALDLDEGGIIWEKIQGQVYSRFMKTHACLYPGVKRFLLHCRINGYKVYVISHKTLYGHFDESKTPIRDVAIDFLRSSNLIEGASPLLEGIYFEDTRESKIDKIINLGLEWFIDDLSEIILALQNQKALKKVFFSSNDETNFIAANNYWASDWQQIDYLVNGDWENSQIKTLLFNSGENSIKKVQKISNGKNAGVYKIDYDAGPSHKLKMYPPDLEHSRVLSESLACSVINKYFHGLAPDLIKKSEPLDYALYQWVEGDLIKIHNRNDLDMSLDFLRTINSIKNSEGFKAAPNASAACFSAQQIENQLRKRLEKFSQAKQNFPLLEIFINTNFIPVMEHSITNAKKMLSADHGFYKLLERDEQILSPSDFGFHNMLKKYDGAICFLDFEYFGWDDPFKLMVDFSFHPAMNLSHDDLRYWLSGALSVFGIASIIRLRAIWPLYALIWCLIVLNEFRVEILHRRLFAKAVSLDGLNAYLSLQLHKSQKHLDKIVSRDFDKLLNTI